MAGEDQRPPEGENVETRLEDRSIPQVAAPARQNNWLVLVFGVAIIALLLWFINKPDETVEPELTAQTPEPFRARTPNETPRLPNPKPTPEPVAVNPVQREDPYRREIEAELQRQALREAEAARQLAAQRRRSPILVFDRSTGNAPNALPTSTAGGSLLGSSGDSETALRSEEAFAARASNETVETMRANRLNNASTVLAQGTLIRGVLETAIQSDLAGLTRAEVASDVYSFDGTRLLIPKGSRLVGRYQSGIVRGQTRVFVIWTRLLRPDGASILIGSPGTDLLGRAGLAGDVDRHFFQMFGSSILLTLIDGAVQVAVADASNNTQSTTISQSGSNLSRAAEIALENSINIPPTIHVDQGTPIQVFVAKDLDFIDVEMTPR